MIWNNRLDIFRNFVTDFNLPKWVKDKNADDKEEDRSFGGMISNSAARFSVGIAEADSVSSIYDDEKAFYDWAAMSWLQRLWHATKSIWSKPPKKVDSRPSLKTVKRVFEKIVDNTKFLESVAAENEKEDAHIGNLLLELAAYSKLIEQARANGQTAFVEKLQDTCLVFLYESVLAACGFNRFVSEEMLIDFLTMHSDKKPAEGEEEPKRYYSGFRLDWMKNFTRVLPDEVAKKKKLADSLLIFDNYVIFHYDPEKAASAMTRAEEEAARKDPILFGVIKGSDKLYFIADWIDEFCDLTLREVVTKLGEVDYKDGHFELRLSRYREQLGDIGKALLEAELKNLDEITRVVRAWLV